MMFFRCTSEHTYAQLDLLAAKPLADSIRDDPETGSYNVKEAVDMFVQKAKEWQGCVRGALSNFCMYDNVC